MGRLTSGNFSPTLGTGIGLALGPSAETPEEGAKVAVIEAQREHRRGYREAALHQERSRWIRRLVDKLIRQGPA